MAELLEIIIPLIKEEWEEVASLLRFDIDSIDTIGKNTTMILIGVVENCWKFGWNQTMEFVLSIGTRC